MGEDGVMIVRWFRQLDAHPASRDAVIGASWLLVGLAALQFGGYGLWGDLTPWQSTGGVFLLTLLGMALIATRRSRRPFAALGAGAAVAGVDLMFGGSLGVVLILTDLIYAAVKYGGDRGVRLLFRWALVAAIGCGAALVVFRPDDGRVVVLGVQWGLVLLVSGLWGWNVRRERLRTRATMSEEHGRATRRLRDRIAHDLHDLVANQIAVAGLHIEAAKLQSAGPRVDSAALTRGLDQAKRGTDEAHRQLRGLITVLTAVEDLDEVALIAPAEALEDLPRLLPAGRVLHWSGQGRAGLWAALDRAPATRSHVVMRVLQELLANAAKHGTGDVQVDVGPMQAGPDPNAQHAGGHGLEVTVTNDRAPAGRVRPGTGIGISGAVLLLSGTGASLDAGPVEPVEPVEPGGDSPTGQWRARLRLPAESDVERGRPA
ncbi:hypothetical protein GCG21_04365 [Pseudactinotalea sp. HY160]|nr:hypothetical protein [Pseudactinotalea sp. HY160]